MIRERFMVIGPVGAGKTSLLAALNGHREEVTKTQAVVYGTYGVDTPGEYLENPRSYRYIIALAQEVHCVLMLHSAEDAMQHFPPGFVSSISVPVLGVVSKADSATGDPVRAEAILRTAGVMGPVFVTSAATGDGLTYLTQHIRRLLSTVEMPDIQWTERPSE